ncbi:MAG: hypothetical protein ABJF04_22470 [Reichenbachiella sp.]|uniref:hypothetical protein n=1 Tax=Reichenbachiella sp. TaxID=2184521 RepID=UPI0032634864
MQTSKKVLLTVAGILLALFVSSLMILRRDIQTINEQTKLANQLTSVPVEEFKFLHFSGLWEVQVKQGRVYKVELTFDQEGSYLPQLENINDTLYFSIDGDSLVSVRARVITPFIGGVLGEDGAHIHLRNFKLDSMSIALNNSHLIGEENEFIYTSYKTTGNSGIELIDDPMK